MAVKKYNKPEMWRSFLESDHLEVTAWLKAGNYLAKDKLLSSNGGLAVIVKGWTEKKKGFLERSIAKFEKQFETTLETNWKKALKNASQAEMKIINDFATKIANGETPKNTKDLERVFKMFRLVLGKSTNNNQNTNANFEVPLTDEEKQGIGDVISRNNAFYKKPGLDTIEQEGDEN